MKAVLLATAILAGCSHSLPHRQSWELYSIQGLYSQQDCPGQHATSIEVNDHTFFLQCYGVKDE